VPLLSDASDRRSDEVPKKWRSCRDKSPSSLEPIFILSTIERGHVAALEGETREQVRIGVRAASVRPPRIVDNLIVHARDQANLTFGYLCSQ